jgi:hypothetical protein
MSAPEIVMPTAEEIIMLGATDSEFFSKHFFPETARQETPAFHAEIDQVLDGPDRFVNLQIFRGAAKTTKLRIYTAKRIAYRISKTILYVGKSQAHAQRNLGWFRKQVERNKIYSNTFQLKPGSKWNDEELQVLCGEDQAPVWLIGIGITGSARGINIDDYRPDLIMIDDVMDEENSATAEQRDKIYKLVHGALKHSLSPKSENPFAKMAILQTPLDPADISERARKDPEFVSVRYGCWTKETENLPVEQRESAWPARWSSEELRAQRIAAQQKNELSLFSKEMECKLIAPEDAVFREEWLQYYGEDQQEPFPPRKKMAVVMVIDPVPPPSEREVEKNLHGKDYEAFAVVGKYQGKLYLLDSIYNRGHDPSWTVAEFFRLARKWQPRKIIVDAVAYQKTLAWLLRQGMKKVGQYWPIEEYVDGRRSKYDRIVQGLKGVASEGALFVRPDHLEFISQFTHYSNVPHDDVIESVAIACGDLQAQLQLDVGEEDIDELEIPSLGDYRGAP